MPGFQTPQEVGGAVGAPVLEVAQLLLAGSGNDGAPVTIFTVVDTSKRYIMGVSAAFLGLNPIGVVDIDTMVLNVGQLSGGVAAQIVEISDTANTNRAITDLIITEPEAVIISGAGLATTQASNGTSFLNFNAATGVVQRDYQDNLNGDVYFVVFSQ